MEGITRRRTRLGLSSINAVSIVSQLTFFRIKPQVTNPDHIIKDRNARHIIHRPIRIAGHPTAHLYLTRVEASRPAWLKYFSGYVDVSGVTLRTASLAAVILVKRPDTLYAVVFGYGRSLLEDSAIESRFGLRAALNAVEPSQLRLIDHKRLEAISRHTREQLSRDASLDHFGLDINRDLLRAVTGVPASKTLGSRISGADQLTFVADVPFDQLAQAIDTYADLANQVTYKTAFPWVDAYHDVRDPSLISKLEKQLCDDLVAGTSTFWLSPPEIIDWDNLGGFRYRDSKKAQDHDELTLDQYFLECGDAQGLANGLRLRSDRVWLRQKDQETARRSWPTLKCLVGELIFDKRRFVLSEGTWYEINTSFLKELEGFIKDVPTSAVDLPDYADASEEAYNKRAWARNKSQLALLDQRFIHYPPRGK